jgi:tRNA-splicing ligase RtcB
MGKIRQFIPVGFNHHKEKQDAKFMPATPDTPAPVITEQYESALTQIGTLGGGNHFCEIQKDENGFIWIMIHSGSRNLGLKVAKYYNDWAIQCNERWYSSVPKEHQLAFFPIASLMGQSYITEMEFCVEFALANRLMMMNTIKNIITESFSKCTFEEAINIAHNYARMENHFGENVMIHRKGATLATKDTTGIIPGSMGTSSFIVKGKGNPESFNSCSHGAGRRMGRKEASRTLDLKNEIDFMDKQGIIHGLRGVKDLDEAPGAYKPITEVMDNQRDLVDIVTELKPVAVIKG